MEKVFIVTNMSTHYRTKLFEELARRLNVHFYFFSMGGEGYWNQKNKLIFGEYPYTQMDTRTFLKSFRSAIAKDKPSVIVKCMNGRIPLPYTFLLAKLRRIPFVLWTGMWDHPHTFFHKLSYPLSKFIYKRADAIVVYGDHVKRYLVEQGIDEKKIFCAWQTVDNAKFNRPVSEEEVAQMRTEYGLPNKKVILYVGRFVEDKGLEYLIEAFGKSKHKDDAVLTLVGNGAYEPKLRELAEQAGIEMQIIPHVPNDQLYKFYKLAYLFVLPSVTTATFKEPWGLVVNEAMNQGTPVISTDSVGAAVGGLMAHGETGFVVPERNGDALAEAIDQLLGDEGLRERMSAAAKREIERWTYPRMADGFTDAIAYAKGKGAR
ncbi:MAG: glycosyltransferase family 4 protein [Tumebacillaceae bacterium]